MARFLKQLTLAGVAFLAALWALSYVLQRWPVFAHDVLGYPKEWVRVAMRLQSAQEHAPGDTLYIGDSVAGQLRPYDGGATLTSNGSVLPMGNYVLVQHALRSRPGLKVVQYMSVPGVIGHKFERPRTCNNLVKPFLTFGNAPAFDGTLYDRLDKRPLAYAYFLPPAKVLPFAEVNFDDGLPKAPEELSALSIHWIRRMDSLCRANGVDLLLRSPPVPESKRAATDDWRRMREQVREAGLDPLFAPYFASVHYLPDSLSSDLVHWDKAYVDAHRRELIAAMERPRPPDGRPR